ncbi:mRNA interferase MazF [Enterococcus sp. PF1-24]|uniref:type II toxin-antitoxin system PemK/MazF family toxin n=1 Tax=unclassified Enterococcus TaxID=2608891 RepID=UPI002475A2F0|nr:MULTISPECIES: type II toxin-antitoxin system PemK/MazF family toxin [unclassified Enterococcus]MDH6364883.1 mRNA interferase MazF [Enterococcus sp. PFB1-1]MDH6401984.1 mRNA interferase MazF [Enterococcus sp. PF1-24]
MVKRGDIYYADLSPVIGSEQGGVRPVLVIQNNLGNHFSPTIIVAAITAKMAKPKLPTHIGIHADSRGIARDSVVLLEQIRTIDKSRLREKVCQLDKTTMLSVNQALLISVGVEMAEVEESI